MTNYKKLLSICLTIILTLSVFSVNTTILAQRNTRHKYVVVTRNHNHTKEHIGKENIHKEHIYKDTSDVIVADMSEYEAEQLEATDEVVAVVEDISLYAHSEESEEQQEQQELWNVQMINAEELIQNEQTVKVGVMDSGINFGDNISVAGNVDFVEEETPFLFPDYSGHGTAVASVISSKNFGVKPNSSMYSIKVIDSSNEALLSNVLSGIYWAIENDIKILNMSFGTATYSPALEQAINDAYNAGILIIASAGNGTDKMYPAGFENVIAVGSLDHKGEVVSENSQHYTNNLLFAPGERVATEGDFGFVQESSGTSFACPHVTAIAAQILEKDQTKSNDFVKSLLFASANTSSGVKVLDAQYALQNYDEFESTYQPTATTPPTLSNTTDLTTFTDVEFEALWGSSRHYETVTESSGYLTLTTRQKNLLKVFSAIPDKTEITQAELQNAGGIDVTIKESSNVNTVYNFTSYFDSTALFKFAGDTDSYSTSDTIGFDHRRILHGRLNYVSVLRYLLETANKLWHGNYYLTQDIKYEEIIYQAMYDSLSEGEKNNNSTMFYGSSARYGTPEIVEGTNSSGYIVIDRIVYTSYTSRQLRRAIERMMYLAAACKSDDVYLSFANEKENFQKEAALKILGIAIHCLGDVYAHKSVIPNDINFVTDEAQDRNNMSYTIYSGESGDDFRRLGLWSGPYGVKTLIIGDGTDWMNMTTHQIKNPWQYAFQSSGDEHVVGGYEDYIDFLPRRYVFAKYSVDKYIDLFLTPNSAFSADIFMISAFTMNGINYRTSMNNYQRLGNLRKYVYLAGLDNENDTTYLRYYDSAVSIPDMPKRTIVVDENGNETEEFETTISTNILDYLYLKDRRVDSADYPDVKLSYYYSNQVEDY